MNSAKYALPYERGRMGWARSVRFPSFVSLPGRQAGRGVRGGRSRAFFTVLLLALISAAFSPAATGCSGGSAVSGADLTIGQKSTVYYIDDHLGSAQILTDSESGLLYEGMSAPYGLDLNGSAASEAESESADESGADYSYTTKEVDRETGLVYFGKRYYSPSMGRWLTPDALFLENPALAQKSPLENCLYSYVKNNPAGNVDIGGEFACGGLCVGAMLVGAALMLPSDSPHANARRNEGGAQIGSMITPVLNDIRDAVELLTGRDFVSGENIGWSGRAFAAAGLLMGSGAAFRRIRHASDVPSKLYHYTGADPYTIASDGLMPGSSGKVFTTLDGGLSPIQAQIDLALPPNRGLPNHLLEIDTSVLRNMGIDVPAPNQVDRMFNMPGGGSEVVFSHSIPQEAISVIR